MNLVRHCVSSLPCMLLLLASACGGSVELTTTDPASTSGSASRSPGGASPTPASSPGDDPMAAANPTTSSACHARPRQSPSGLDSCNVARASMTLGVTGITWTDPALAWKQGGHAQLEVRYENGSEADPIEYPGAVVTSSDRRAQTDTEAHGDPVVHPDLYALSACMVYASHDHGFTLLSTVPSGTKLTFTVAAAVADGNGISSCSGTLPTAVASFVAP